MRYCPEPNPILTEEDVSHLVMLGFFYHSLVRPPAIGIPTILISGIDDGMSAEERKSEITPHLDIHAKIRMTDASWPDPLCGTASSAAEQSATSRILRTKVPRVERLPISRATETVDMLSVSKSNVVADGDRLGFELKPVCF